MSDIEKLQDRAALIDAADLVRQALVIMNERGDPIDSALVTQVDGLPYGDIRKGLVNMAKILWGDELGPLIVNDALDSSATTLSASAMFFIERKRQRDQDRANARWIIESTSENACWSNDAGWVPVEQATIFTTAEMEQFNLPLVTDNEVCWTRIDETAP